MSLPPQTNSQYIHVSLPTYKKRPPSYQAFLDTLPYHAHSTANHVISMLHCPCVLYAAGASSSSTSSKCGKWNTLVFPAWVGLAWLSAGRSQSIQCIDYLQTPRHLSYQDLTSSRGQPPAPVLPQFRRVPPLRCRRAQSITLSRRAQLPRRCPRMTRPISMRAQRSCKRPFTSSSQPVLHSSRRWPPWPVPCLAICPCSAQWRWSCSD